MSKAARVRRSQQRAAAFKIWLASRSSQNQTLIDRLCRAFLARALRTPPEKDHMRDPFVDDDRGFDPDELDRYQRGEAP